MFLASACNTLAAESVPPAASRLLYQVSRLYQHEEYAKAAELVERFRKDTERYADHPDVLFAKANCCLAMQKYRCAVRTYRKVVSARPERAAAWQNMASAFYHLQNYREAAQSFAEAFEVQKKKSPDLLYYCGVSFLMAGDGHEAVNVLQKLFDRYAGKVNPEWKEAMARALIADNRNREALPLLRELVASACRGVEVLIPRPGEWYSI